MADHDPELEEDEEVEEQEWLDPVDDADDMDDGPVTIFVGGFSPVKSLDEALAQARPGDRIIVLAGRYDTDAQFDTHRHRGIAVEGDPADRAAVVFTGRLVLSTDQPPATAPPDEDEEAPPAPLALAAMTFLGGAEFGELTDAAVAGCAFGEQHTPVNPADEPPARTVRCHAFATVRVEGSLIYGLARSAVYCFPRTACAFSDTVIEGATPAPPPAPQLTKREKRLLAAQPPVVPPPVPPSACCCEAGVQCDNADATFTGCTIRRFNIGVLTGDVCKGLALERCRVTGIFTVGVLLGQGATAAVRRCKLQHCGREVLVVSKAAHPVVRENVICGRTRLQAGCIATGCTDNLLSATGTVTDESGAFSLKGFTKTATESPPTPRAPRPPSDDDEAEL